VKIGDVVTLTDPMGEHTGTVTKILDEDGMVAVTWNSGVTERVHESELSLAGRTLAPRPGDDVWDAEEGRINPGLLREEAEADEAYEADDPKHPTFRERLSALWDARPGK
jgi:hypothetical protein